MVLSPRSLPYARLALQSLYANCTEPLSLTLITDGPNDVLELRDELQSLGNDLAQPSRAAVVYGEADLADLEQDRFGSYAALRHFRHGHPCWRKVTDALLVRSSIEVPFNGVAVRKRALVPLIQSLDALPMAGCPA